MKRKVINTIRGQVYELLKQAICDGEFEPGQWLQENELAEKLSVSRSPIREALRQLAADGLVIEVPNKGVFVREFTAKDIEEIFDIRVLMENYAIDKMNEHLTEEDSTQLKNCMKPTFISFWTVLVQFSPSTIVKVNTSIVINLGYSMTLFSKNPGTLFFAICLYEYKRTF